MPAQADGSGGREHHHGDDIKIDDVDGVAAFYRDVAGLIPDDTAPDSANRFWIGEPGKPVRFTVSKGRAAASGSGLEVMTTPRRTR